MKNKLSAALMALALLAGLSLVACDKPPTRGRPGRPPATEMITTLDFEVTSTADKPIPPGRPGATPVPRRTVNPGPTADKPIPPGRPGATPVPGGCG
jgi:hypothetical protein